MKFSFSNIFHHFMKLFDHPTEDSLDEKEVLSDKDLISIKDSISAEKENLNHPFYIISSEEREIIRSIKMETYRANQNNVTRTDAYLQFYLRNPELHWSFLAHMVSRNGGYYMTDLKSSFIPDLMPINERERYFLFLERCNAHIFQDAYPQLLLYEYCVKKNKAIFHLLKSFHVSTFMVPLWESFFNNRNSQLITIGMIINEQKMLDKRVIQSIYQSQSVLDEIPYKFQESLGFTTVLFPYKKNKRERISLCGQEVKDFSSVVERILIGKKLYQILFSSNVYNSSLQFAESNRHTGSRSDYWSWLFSNEENDGRVYSPSLQKVWPDVNHSFIQKHNWFQSDHVNTADYLSSLPAVKEYDLTKHILGQYSVLAAFEHLNDKLFN